MNRCKLSESTLIAMAQESIDRHPGNIEADSNQWLSMLPDGFEELIEKALHSSIADTSSHSSSNEAGGDFPEGSCLGRFKLIRPLGHGGFGVVLLAFDPKLERHVALKLPRPDLLGRKTWRKQFIHEARAAAALDHPNIVKLHDIGRSGPVLYLASSYCDGPTLAEWMRQHGPVSPREAATLIAQVADAVQHAHSRGVLHRDLKPANILLSQAEQRGRKDAALTPLVTDFGLASRFDGRSGISSGFAGTLPYIAPEQLNSEQESNSTAIDVYSLGAILFELLTGRPPFQAGNETTLIEAIRSGLPKDVTELRRNIPRDIAAICRKCLESNPSDRYESAAELARDLRRFVAGVCVVARPVGRHVQLWRWCRQRPLVASLATALGLAVACGVVLSTTQWLRAERHLRQSREAVIDLGWAIDDAVFWQGNENEPISPSVEALSGRFVALLNELGEGGRDATVDALAECYMARMDEFERCYDSARQRYLRSLNSWRKVVHETPDDARGRQALARTLYYYGRFLVSIDGKQDGLHRIERGKLIGLFDPRTARDEKVVSSYADLLYSKGEALASKKRRDQSAMHFVAAIALYRSLSDASPGESWFRFRRCQAEIRYMGVQRPIAFDDSPYDLRREILDELRELVDEYPQSHEYRTELAAVAAWMAANGRRYDQGEESEQSLRDAIAALTPVVDSERASTQAQTRYARVWLRLAELCARKHRSVDACEYTETALHWYEIVYAGRGSNVLPLAQAYRLAAGVYLQCNDRTKAMESFERSVKLYACACGTTPRTHRIHTQHADALKKLATLYAKENRTADAKAAYEEAVAVLERWRGPDPQQSHIAEELRRLKVRIAELDLHGLPER